MKFFRIALVFLLVMLVAGVAVAQDAGPTLSPGETLEVNASDTVTATFVVETPAMLYLVVQSVDGETQPSIRMANASGNLSIYSNSGSPEVEGLGENDVVLGPTLYTPGEYTLEVDAFFGDGNVVVTTAEAVSTTLGPATLEVYEGEVASGGRFAQNLEFALGEVVTIVVDTLSEDLDPALTVRDSSGAPVIETINNDFAYGESTLDFRDTALIGFPMPVEGELAIEIEDSFSGDGSGPVSLMIFRYGIVSFTEPTSMDTEGEVVDAGRVSIAFEGQAGEVVTITARATDANLDPVMTIRNADGVIVAQNDDHRLNDPALGNTDSGLANLILPDTGGYVVEIEPFNQGSGGTFVVTITRVGTYEPAG